MCAKKTPKGQRIKKPSKAMKEALKAVENIGKAKESVEQVEFFLSEALEEAFETLDKIKKNKTWH